MFYVLNDSVGDLAIASYRRTGPNGNVVFKFRSPPGTTYTVQYSTTLTTGSWVDIGSVTSDGTSASFTDTSAVRLAQPRGF